MRAPRIVTQSCIDRRTFLRGAGVALALPFLDSMTPAFSTTPCQSIRQARFPMAGGSPAFAI